MWDIEITKTDGAVYVHHDKNFVARFKYANPTASANHFVKFLVKNFTVNEYFKDLDNGIAPLTILKCKGFESYNVLQAMKLIDKTI